MLDLTTGVAGMGFDLRADQHSAWLEQARVLQHSLAQLCQQVPTAAVWGLLLEYQIPGRPKRLDAVLLDGAGIIAIEFKVGATEFLAPDKWQLREYCWNLRDFHRESEAVPIAPLLVATAAPEPARMPNADYEDRHRIVQRMLFANAQTLSVALSTAHERLLVTGSHPLDLERWDSSQAQPTRTVIAEAQRLFEAHDVSEISHAYADNTADALDCIFDIVRESRAGSLRSICFVTGVPGAGKTLVGLHAAYSPAMIEAAASTATFASGNQPLLDVLNAALALNRTTARRERREIGHNLSAPVENVHRFALEHLLDPAKRPPPQQVVIFDEAQRVWTADKVAGGLGKRIQRAQLTIEQRDAILAEAHSEPDFLLRVMERCPAWCVIVALVGGGQEIHTGEAGLGAWGRALSTSVERWTTWVSPEALQGGASVAGQTLFAHALPPNLDIRPTPRCI
ncbi:MAG: DNA/RNA helicase domain-containing protein [Chthoniobacterales bacterium]